MTAFYRDLSAVAYNLTFCGSQFFQRFYRVFRFAFLHDSKHRIQQNDGNDNNHFRYAADVVYNRDNKTYYGGDYKYDQHRIGKLFEKPHRKRRFFLFPQLVLSVKRKPGIRFRRAQSVFARTEFGKNLFRSFEMIFHFDSP